MKTYRFRVEYRSAWDGPWFVCTEITRARDDGEARENILERHRHNYETHVTLMGESQ